MDQLTEQAIANSAEIAALDDRLTLVGKQVKRQYERRWTAIFPGLADLLRLNPLGLIESVFGGGSFRDVNLRIADLETRTSELVRRRAELTVALREQVSVLVLGYEKAGRDLDLARSQLETHRQRLAILEVSYRLGAGETTAMLPQWQRTEDLLARITELEVGQKQVVRRLEVLIGDEEQDATTPH